jgi:vancomycin resistance protein YoaR
MDAPETDKRLAGLFKDNAPEVDEEALGRRVAARRRQKQRRRRRADGIRVLAVACASVLVIAGAGYGIYAAVGHFTGKPVVVLTDSTVSAGVADAPTTDPLQDPAAQARVKTMTSAPVTLRAGGKTFTLTPAQIEAALDFPLYSDQTPSTPVLSANKLTAFFATVAPVVEVAAVDATFASDDTKTWVVPGKDGIALDAAKTAAQLTLAARQTGDRVAAAVTIKKEPNITTAEAQAMGITAKLSSYTTAYNCTGFRRTNVKVATSYSTNVLLAPGEEFDFDKQLGPRTSERGWKIAPGITGPNTIEDVLGGGITQVATTLFNAVAGGRAGLKITERHNHALFIAHYPKGRDAAVTGGNKNLRFVNDMDHYVWITGSSDGVTTSITVWGTDEGRSTSWSVGDFYNLQEKTQSTVIEPRLKSGQTTIVQNGQTGRSLETERVVSQNGKVIHDDTFLSVWPMYPDVVGVGK